MDHRMSPLCTTVTHSLASFCLKLLSRRYTNMHSWYVRIFVKLWLFQQNQLVSKSLRNAWL
ncbi:hypothetical protein B4U80_02860 [Leptotrombidium deliense]|uniref:Uncharacterized protein n=1 Tax=Leptotrombidium deliense TaxID=299467 RepID=A0A443RSD7_9ACAR|nr:hypothetical protein B4U80_02860 [Leptotrombidium deliense]